MITQADVDKLSTIRAAGPSVLSLYLAVPEDPGQLRELPAHAGHLMGNLEVAAPDQGNALAKVAALGQDWLGHGVAIFASAELRLLEVYGCLTTLRSEPCSVSGPTYGRCLAGANAHAVETLVVPYDGLVAGFRCARCEMLCVADCDCPDWGIAAQPVADLIEEMVSCTLADGGRVYVVAELPGGPLAELRFPVGTAQGQA